MWVSRRADYASRAVLALAPFVALLLVAACARPPETLLQRAHREYYALQPAELERAAFFVSERIVAHELADAADAPTPARGTCATCNGSPRTKASRLPSPM